MALLKYMSFSTWPARADIIYEPWHYRYVGREDAEQIHTLGVCLEEYLEGTF